MWSRVLYFAIIGIGIVPGMESVATFQPPTTQTSLQKINIDILSDRILEQIPLGLKFVLVPTK